MQNGCRNPTLPMCLSYVNNQQAKEAKALSLRAKWALERKSDLLLLTKTPKEMEVMLFLSVCAKQYDQVWDMAKKIKRDPISLRFQTPSVYLLLLHLVAAKNGNSNAMLALNLYRELYQANNLSAEEHELAATLLFSVFRNCSDFTLLLPLKSVYESIVVHQFGASFEYSYIGACLDILVNCQDYDRAVSLLDRYMATIYGTEDVSSALEALPVPKILDYMCTVQDCDNLLRWVKVVSTHNEKMFNSQEWLKYLGVALLCNHYPLVKFIYEQWIMAGLSTRLTVEEVIFESKISELPELNSALQTLADSTLHQVLHTLSSHGDVELTLNLIEWHYIHKLLKGEQALTKELCVDIIHSYCFFVETELDLNGRDRSLERVLDVINSFISRSNSLDLSYKDISDAISHKIHCLSIEDDNVVEKQKKLSSIHQFIETVNEDDTANAEMPRKSTNSNVSISEQGNPLLNTTLLSGFIEDHMRYLLTGPADQKTIRIFVNCMLNHIGKFQNFSGILVALQSLKSLNSHLFEDWLSQDLFDIMIRSISASPAARLTGFELYKFLKERGQSLSKTNMVHFILSSLRGQDYHLLFEFYVYEYLCSCPKSISTQLIQRITKFTHLEYRGKLVLQFLEECRLQAPEKNQVDQYWTTHNLNCSSSNIGLQPKESLSPYDRIDTRDCQYLRSILPT